jgi:hypothetical protein
MVTLSIVLMAPAGPNTAGKKSCVFPPSPAFENRQVLKISEMKIDA